MWRCTHLCTGAGDLPTSPSHEDLSPLDYPDPREVGTCTVGHLSVGKYGRGRDQESGKQSRQIPLPVDLQTKLSVFKGLCPFALSDRCNTPTQTKSDLVRNGNPLPEGPRGTGRHTRAFRQWTRGTRARGGRAGGRGARGRPPRPREGGRDRRDASRALSP